MSSVLWDPAAEAAPRGELVRLQDQRLRQVVARVWARVPFYRERLAAAGLTPEEVRGIADLPRLPFTTKADLRRLYPFGHFACPPEEVVELHCSSGTTGYPTATGYTRADLDVWAEVMARSLTAAGVRPGDLIQNAYGYGLFTGGLGFHYGALRLGARVLPTSTGNTARQVRLLREFGATALACTPSYALHLAEVVEESTGGPLRLRCGLFGAEPWCEETRAEIERRLGLRAADFYGLSEVIGPGVAAECEARAGLHVHEDHFLPEVIDPATGTPLPPGQRGELVLTTLTREATPLLRYRTGDIAALVPEPCVCGRTHVRMTRVAGRIDDMLVIRGVNVFPSEVETVLGSLPDLAPQYQLVVDRARGLDVLEVQVEARADTSPAHYRALAERLRQALRDALGLAAAVTVLPPRQLPRSDGKAVRVVDRRVRR
ncbi:MAG: phenylacetate--CoA ligase [Armatimonadota bacterium]|nr:phenylacetate--CoA ligase [Armatimonadota bacterium]MDR7532591.1 phenylacetate--CoA ligase [Armatimonadota bacterium]MDR7536200.1 phenylacetate--CoA ligase [Armatimonadota bacterium]